MRNVTTLIFFTLYAVSCSPIRCNFFVKTPGPFTSPSIEESKEVGALIYEYKPFTIDVSDTIRIEVKEAFLEKMYGYYSTQDLRYNISEDTKQIVLVLDTEIAQKTYNKYWRLDGFAWQYPFSLSKRFKSGIPKGDTVLKILFIRNYKEKESDPFFKEAIKEIGTITLYKKE